MFTSNADYAHAIWLAARTSDEGRRHEGISIILADTDLPGVEIRPVLTMGGHNTTEVTFTDVRVPADRLVGELNHGWSYMMEALDHERMAGLSCGGLRRDLEGLAAAVFGSEESCPQREQLIIDATIEVAAVRTHFERALARLERGEVPSSEATMLKLRASEVRQWLSDRVIDEFGAESLLKGDEPGIFWRVVIWVCLAVEMRPTPKIAIEEGEFWEAVTNRIFMLATCMSCATILHPPSPVCFQCHCDEIRFQEVSPTGTVVAFTTVFYQFVPGESVPYALVSVELDAQDDLVFTSELIDMPAGCEPHIGMAVEVAFAQRGDLYLPVFRPVPVP
jgi:uncharacterized OB-fold protein